MKTSRDVLVRLQAALTERYEAQLKVMPFKPATRDALVDGFRDGVRGGMFHLCEMMGIEVEDEDTK